MDIGQYLSSRKKIVDKAVLSHVPFSQKYTKVLLDAVKYSLMSGGKRIRPVLVLAVSEAVSNSQKKALPLAVAIEMIHTYTLIHDDLPAMDDDDLRRGKPTCHKVYGEDVAILAGDMLNTLAFQIIADNYKEKAALLVSQLASALGINGVVGGQMADLRSVGRNIDTAELDFITTHKTADLFVASARCAGIVAGASKNELTALTKYALHLGLAFQIIDDILDYTGKQMNSYPGLLGIEKSGIQARKALKVALNALPRSSRYDKLREMALFLSKRKE